MSREEHIKRLIVNHKRRLQTLEEKQALYGLDAPPHILTEIEDIEANIEKLQTELKALANSRVNEKSQRTLTNLAKNTNSMQRVEIYLQGDFPSLSADRRSAAIVAFAAVMEISPQAIEVYQKEVG